MSIWVLDFLDIYSYDNLINLFLHMKISASPKIIVPAKKVISAVRSTVSHVSGQLWSMINGANDLIDKTKEKIRDIQEENYFTKILNLESKVLNAQKKYDAQKAIIGQEKALNWWNATEVSEKKLMELNMILAWHTDTLSKETTNRDIKYTQELIWDTSDAIKKQKLHIQLIDLQYRHDTISWLLATQKSIHDAELKKQQDILSKIDPKDQEKIDKQKSIILLIELQSLEKQHTITVLEKKALEKKLDWQKIRYIDIATTQAKLNIKTAEESTQKSKLSSIKKQIIDDALKETKPKSGDKPKDDKTPDKKPSTLIGRD